MPKSKKAFPYNSDRRKFLEENSNLYYPPPPIGGNASNTEGMSKMRRAIVNMTRGNNNISNFQNFLNECENVFDEAIKIKHELEALMDIQRKRYKYIFGMQNENLDQLVIKIQTSEMWSYIDAGSVDLPLLNSHSVNKNRKRLKVWLLKERPTEGLRRLLINDDEIKDEIEKIQFIVEKGRMYLETVYNDQDRAKEQGDLFVARDGFSSKSVIYKYTQNAKCKVKSWEDFLNEWTGQKEEQSMMLVTFDEIMEWRKERHLKREAVKARINAGITVEHSTQVLPKRVLSASVFMRLCQRIEDINNKKDDGISEKEILREIEVDVLKTQLA